MNSITKPYDYTPADASFMGVSFVFAGVIGGIVFSVLLDKYQCYNKMLRIINLGSLIAGGLALYFLPLGNVYLFCLNMALIGLFLLPIISVGYSFCAELAYPTSDSLSSGIMVLLSQIFGTIVSYAATILIEKFNSPLGALAMFCTQFTLSLLLSFVLKEDLRRLN